MELLHNVDIPGSNVDEYVKNLDNMLNEKQELLTSLKVKITNFRDHLKEEEVLSKKFYEQRSHVAELFDTESQQHSKLHQLPNEDFQLLEDLSEC